MSARHQTQQQDLSQTLNLLESINYQDPEAKRSNTDERTDTSKLIIRILDTIALCITTGKPGDVVASAFKHTDQGETMIYLARNGEPSPKDISSAPGFLSTLLASKNQSMRDILPWIAYHGPEMVQKRVNKLQELVNKDKNEIFRIFLNRQIDKYCIPVWKGIETEFPNSASVKYLKSEGYDLRHIESSTVQVILVGILKKFHTGLTFNTHTSSHSSLESLVFAAATLRDSVFLRNLLKKLESADEIDPLNMVLREKASKFYRRVNKVNQYIRIIDLIKYVQSKGPFKIEWVYRTDMNNTLCYQFRDLELQSGLITALGIARRFNLKELTPKRLMECFHRMKSFRSAGKEDPSKNRHVNTYVHAELKLIVFLLSITPQRLQDQEIEHCTIGCSKRSCLYCTFWIKELQEILKPNVHRFIYYTAGSHGSPYATCARVGPFKQDPNGLCSNKVEERLKGLADEQITTLPDRASGHIKNKDSEDHASASDSNESFERFPQP
ncbi:hypothetical protein C0989_008817 [Termitomyces sp. Mn162]|nr:hypothetical protein C0989_008817 [Termitomyces sp. Mn162]